MIKYYFYGYLGIIILFRLILVQYNPKTLQKMINISKKNLVSTHKNVSSHQKKLKRSKSTDQILAKKILKKSDQNSKTQQYPKHSLTKSKSTKSLKSKPKPPAKSESTIKKMKVKKLTTTKTIKKNGIKEDMIDYSSIISDDWQSKKINLEYFIYHNNYIPIENSAQRRFVYKIHKIDCENTSTASTFCSYKKEDKGIQTQVIPLKETKEIAIGQALEVCNQLVQTQKFKYEERTERCFVDVLTELQFLYLPNQQNFVPFTQVERIHYGEMLQALAKKMLGYKRQVVNQACLTDQQITVLLYQRQGIQVGALEFIPLEGFPTHLLSILAYLKNLFCFVEYGFKQQILASLRLFYGLNYNQRIKRLTNGLPHQLDNRLMLSEQLFQIFETQMFKDYQFNSELIKQSVHIHNKAIFDSVNHELQVFRPFFSSQGEPFPWTNNLGMTHYDITEQVLFIIFLQIKEKIQKQVITLCGMHTDFDDQTLPRGQKSPLFRTKMQQRQNKMLFEQIKLYDDKVEIDYQTSSLMFDISSEIFYELIQQIEKEWSGIVNRQDQVQDIFNFIN